eukprot:508314-Pyramimonas_sp.AAC.1
MSGYWRDQGWGGYKGYIRVVVGSEAYNYGVAPHSRSAFSFTWTLPAPSASGSQVALSYNVGWGGGHCLYVDSGANLA